MTLKQKTFLILLPDPLHQCCSAPNSFYRCRYPFPPVTRRGGRAQVPADAAAASLPRLSFRPHVETTPKPSPRAWCNPILLFQFWIVLCGLVIGGINNNTTLKVSLHSNMRTIVFLICNGENCRFLMLTEKYVSDTVDLYPHGSHKNSFLSAKLS